MGLGCGLSTCEFSTLQAREFSTTDSQQANQHARRLTGGLELGRWEPRVATGSLTAVAQSEQLSLAPVCDILLEM